MYEGAKALRRKVWTRTKIVSSNINYFVVIFRFVTIYALFGNLWATKVFFGQEVHYYMVFIAYQARARSCRLKGLRAESARDFTGRRNSYSGRGEDFLTGQPNFFTETAVTPQRKVEKLFPMWDINRHAEA